jgi:ubiquitin thioesterase protein OTUB1
VYLRLLTSGQLQKEEEFYQNFVEGDKTIKEFCQQV